MPPPLRPWGEFFPAWKTPTNFTDFYNRLNSNLYYYQTNYLAFGAAVYIIAGFKDPLGVGNGVFTMLFVVLLTRWLTCWFLVLPFIARWRRRNPITFLIIDIIGAHGAARERVDTTTFLSATIIFLAVTFLHASLCNRNMNEVACVKEAQDLKGTPMGFLLRAREREREKNK
ncbi:PRA1 family protein 3-like [Poeciliopsis prolifica]|uniref:PRA1 family protein 3-like n=1 Tax=Poeciliopsis prolifica TaxID=188132 RepID=UPI002413C161|nr:PRA1 family protein 3-like [Poeciliopsis prolifica]